MYKIIISIVSVFSFALLSAGPVAAQGIYMAQSSQTTMSTEPTTPTEPATQDTTQSTATSTPAVQTKEYTGEILKVERNKLTIDTKDGTQAFKVSSSIKVKRNTADVAITELKPGDRVTVKAQGNEALSISATAGSLLSKLIRVAIIVGIVLLLLLIVHRILKKRNKGFVTTKPTNLSEGA